MRPSKRFANELLRTCQIMYATLVNSSILLKILFLIIWLMFWGDFLYMFWSYLLLIHQLIPDAPSSLSIQVCVLLTIMPHSPLQMLRDHCKRGGRNRSRARSTICQQRNCIFDTPENLHMWTQDGCDNTHTKPIKHTSEPTLIRRELRESTRSRGVTYNCQLLCEGKFSPEFSSY